MPSAITARRVLGTWDVPLKGTLRSLPIHKVPPDALWSSQNVTIRNGMLQTRSGLTLYSNTSLVDPVIGAVATANLASGTWQSDFVQTDSFQVSANVAAFMLMAGTTRKIWAYYGGAWHDITATALTATATNVARFTSIAIGGVIYIIHVNRVDSPYQWDGTSTTVTAVAGSPPLFADVTTIGDHVIGIVPPYDVRWGNNLLLTAWPSLNIRTLSDTADPVMAIRNLGILGGIVYKSHSIWAVNFIGGTEASSFEFQFRGFYKGPAGPAAVVDRDGVHYYMTTTGRIAAFDGTTHLWVADGVWDLVKADIDQASAGTIFGVYDPNQDEVLFYYPATDGTMRVVVILPPNPMKGIETHIAFWGTAFTVTTGTTIRIDAEKALLFGGTPPQAYEVTTTAPITDGGQTITSTWQTGVVPTPGLEEYRAAAFEVFAVRGVGYGTLNITPVKSDVLDAIPPTVTASAIAVDLTTTPVKEFKGLDLRGRFFGLKGSLDSKASGGSILQYSGSRLAGDQIENRRVP